MLVFNFCYTEDRFWFPVTSDDESFRGTGVVVLG